MNASQQQDPYQKFLNSSIFLFSALIIACLPISLYQGYTTQTISLIVSYYACCFLAAGVVAYIRSHFRPARWVAHCIASGLFGIFLAQSSLAPLPQLIIYPCAWAFVVCLSERMKITPDPSDNLS